MLPTPQWKVYLSILDICSYLSWVQGAGSELGSSTFLSLNFLRNVKITSGKLVIYDVVIHLSLLFSVIDPNL